MKMRNRFIAALLTLVAIFAFSNLASAQDPEGTLDNLTVDCNTNIFPGAPTVATFDIVFHSDNTGGNKIAGFAIPLVITGTCGASIDTTKSTAFDNTILSAFSILTVTKETNPDPTVQPFAMTYGAVNFTGGVTGTGDFAHIAITVNDTCCFVIDTTHTPLIPDPNFITELAQGFIPGWTPGNCCISPYINQNPTVNCGQNLAVFAGATINEQILANDPDAQAGICANIVSSSFQFLDSLLVPIGGPDTYPCGNGTGLTGALGSPNVSQNFNWNTTGCAGGTYCVVFTYTDECGGSGADTCCYTIKTACAFVTIGEVTADPCQTVELPVILSNPGSDIGGFNFCIEFSNADLTVV